MIRIVDVLMLIVLLPFIIPIFIIVSLFAFIFHGKSIFFKQKRLGIKKQQFELYKFRSMIHGAQNIGTGLYSYENDNRITPFGKFLRKSSLDEIPQIINVFKGEMSFVGPRPAVVGELEVENDLPHNTDDRFLLKPGLTGWAQIHGRDNLSWKEKIIYDLEFVNASRLKRFFICIYTICFTPFYLLNFSATYEKQK